MCQYDARKCQRRDCTAPGSGVRCEVHERQTFVPGKIVGCRSSKPAPVTDTGLMPSAGRRLNSLGFRSVSSKSIGLSFSCESANQIREGHCARPAESENPAQLIRQCVQEYGWYFHQTAKIDLREAPPRRHALHVSSVSVTVWWKCLGFRRKTERRIRLESSSFHVK